MNNVSENQSKDRILKALAVGGFIGLIIIIAWLSIKMVSYLPTALSSLASLADGVYNYKPTEIVVVSNKNIVNVDEPFTLTWSVPTKKGTFAFSHSCVDGVAIDIRTADGSLQSINCATNYNIGSTDSLEIVAVSEKERFVDVPYRVDFIPTRDTAPAASSSGMITVVNASISPVAIDTDEEPETETPVIEEEPEIIAEEPEEPETETPVRPAPQPQYVQEYIYGIPVSDPNGFTDLAAKFISTGTFVGGTYRATGAIDNDTQGAIQFEVKNIGTKTSDTWTFTAKLPNGQTYTSPSQKALKPNEQAILTIGFSAPNTNGVKTFSIKVEVRSDSKPSNNSFNAVVLINE